LTAQGPERLDIARRFEAVHSPTIGVAQKRIGLSEEVTHTKRGRICRIDKDHIATHHVGNRSGKKWVVRATKQQRVNISIYEWRQETLGQHMHLL
jgi:deoxyinosine 3'endonuclease (endonuclease V)